MYDVITIGGAVRDETFLFNSIKEKKKNGKYICFLSGAKINVDQIYFTSGGGACNVAVGLSRLGLKAAPIVCIGNDISGRAIINDLKKNKVETKFIKIDRKYHTAISSIISQANIDRTIFTYRGANNQLQINNDRLPETKWIYIAALDGNWQKILNKVINLKLKNPNLKIAWNPGIVQLRAGKKKLNHFLKKIDVLILNKRESSILTKKSDKNIIALLKALHDLGPKIGIITCAEDGAFVINNKDIYYSKAQPKKVVDTTGAGDSFSSGFLAGLIIHNDIKKALKLGILNSAANLTQVGAQDGLLTKKDLKKIKFN